MEEQEQRAGANEDGGLSARRESALEKGEGPQGGSQRPTLSRPATTATNASRRRSVLRVISNNGYGCDDAEACSGDSTTPDGENPTDNESAEKDPFEIGWDGGDSDPMCPRSMPLWRKWVIVGMTSFGSFCVTCASSIYTATYGQMDAEFGTSRIVATLGLTSFVVGIALGPFSSPLSEFYGRRWIYLIAFAFYLVFLIPPPLAQNIETVIIPRFFQGLAGSAFLSIAGGTVGDLFTPPQMQVPITVFTMAPFVGPSVGPLLGGFINSFANWRWTHWLLLIWSGCYYIGLILLVPETYHPVILRHKAEKRRKETGDDRYYAPMERTKKSKRQTIVAGLLRPFQLLIFEYMVLLLCLYSALLLGVLYLFFGAFPLIFENNHGFNLWQVGLTFLGLLVGMLIAASATNVWRTYRLRLIEKNGGVSEPEFRLPSTVFGSVLCSIGLFWFAFSSYPWVPWILPIIGSAIFGAGTLLAFTGIFSFLVEAFPLYAASAIAANAFVRCMFAGAFPLFGVQMYEKLGYEWASALLGFLSVAMLPFPYLFFRFGKRIRARSSYATSG